MQSLYKQLHNLKQHGNVEEYSKAFYQPVTRVDLNESEESMVARFLSGLKSSIQDALSLHQLWSVSKAYNRALMFERQLERKAFVQFQAYGCSRSIQVSTQGSPTTNSAQPFKIDSASLPSQLLVQSNQSLKQHKVLHLSATSVEKLGTRPQIARKGELMLKERVKL